MISGEISISGLRKAAVVELLENEGYDKMMHRTKAQGRPIEVEEGSSAAAEEESSSGANYDYLLTMPLNSLTYEKVSALLLLVLSFKRMLKRMLDLCSTFAPGCLAV